LWPPTRAGVLFNQTIYKKRSERIRCMLLTEYARMH
jgi:hypothetical protein